MSDLLEGLSVKGGGTTPRSAAQEAANERGSNAPLPSTSSAEAPSASASLRSAARSAAISLAIRSGTRSRFHSRRHSSTNSLTPPPPLPRDPARHRPHRARPAIQTRRPRVHVVLDGTCGSTFAAVLHHSRRDVSPQDRRAPGGRAAGRSNPHRQSRDRGHAVASSSCSHKRTPPRRRQGDRGRALRFVFY